MKNLFHSTVSGLAYRLCLTMAVALLYTFAHASANSGKLAGAGLRVTTPGLSDGYIGLTVGINSVNTLNDFCGAGGSITVSFSGGVAPYSISWTGGGPVSSVSSPYTVSGLAAGSYVVTVTDVNGSSASTTSQTISSFSIKNQNSGAGYNNLQSAINAATPGDIIELCAGTFSSAVTVNKKLDIRGQGNGTILQNVGGDVVTYTAAGSGTSAVDRAYMRNLKISGSGKGMRADQLVNYVTLDGVTIDGNTTYGIHINNITGLMNDWAITNCTFNNNSSAIYISTAANLNGLSITGSTFTNQVNSGIYVGQSSTAPGGLSNVTITGNTFTGNGPVNNQAALYIEKLSNATISGNTFTNNGLDVNPRGISINLKYGNYTGVTINGNTFIENRGATQNTSGANSGYALTVSGRNDFPSYGTNPGTLSNVSITNNEVTGFIRGIQVENATDWTTTTVENNKLNGCALGIIGSVFGTLNQANFNKTLQVHNNSVVGSIRAFVNTAQNGATMDVSCNWFGTASSNSIDTLVIDTIVNGIVYTPWLTNGTDNSASIGFQPVPNSCNGTPVSFTSVVTDVTCFGLANGGINLTVSGGSLPYTYTYNGNPSTEDRTDLTAGQYLVVVTDANGSSFSATITVNQPAGPSPAGAISGTAVGCVTGLASSRSFSVPVSTNAVTYSWAWTGSNGASITAGNGTQNITLSYTASAIQAGVVGTLTVTPIDACNNQGVPSSVYVEYQVTQPVTPPSISGPGKLCPGDSATYSVAAVARATSYTWTFPTAMTVVSGAGTNIIRVVVGSGYIGGSVTVTAVNTCGTSPTRTKSVVLNLPPAPGTISGQSTGLCGVTGAIYSITPVTVATSYLWSVTNGSFNGSTTGTSASVNWLSNVTSGSLSVISINACGSSSARTLSVSLVPGRPNPITGVVNPACINSNDTASVASVAGATAYVWQITSGGTITLAAGKDAFLTWGASPATSQSITVRATNSCGTGLTRALTGISVVTCFNRMSSSAGQELELEVFPNPAREWMQCSFRSETEQRYQIRMLDLSGRLVMVEEGTSDAGLNRIDLTPANISSGAYMLHLTVGDSQSVQRVVIE